MTGAQLRYFREVVMRWTQAQAAQWYGVSLRSWRRWEHQPNVPQPVTTRVAELNTYLTRKQETL